MSFRSLKVVRAALRRGGNGRFVEETQNVSKGRFGRAEPKWCASIRVVLVAVALCVAAFTPAQADTYAYKVQYLESSGKQYIDTGVVPDRNTMFRGSYEYLGTAGAKANYDMIAACAQPRYYPISLNSASDTHARRERYVSYNDTPNQLHPYLTRHTIVFLDPLVQAAAMQPW